MLNVKQGEKPFEPNLPRLSLEIPFLETHPISRKDVLDRLDRHKGISFISLERQQRDRGRR